MNMQDTQDIAEALLIADGRHPDPFAFLGPHNGMVRTFQPDAVRVEMTHGENVVPLLPVGNTGVFIGQGEGPYCLHIHWPGTVQKTEDPYSFAPILGDIDLHLFSEGTHWDLSERFGAAVDRVDGIDGVRFAVWAPNAQRVSVVGDFNNWDGRRHPMRLRHSAGVWEIFIPRLTAGERYKYEILGPDGVVQPLKADPMARATEHPPATASVVPVCWSYEWTDADWMGRRADAQSPSSPLSIYETHVGSWLRPEHGETIDWRGLASKLIPYVSALGFTHIELLPIMEHPFGGSWGYQPLSQFAPSARYGSAEEFAHFVDSCHRAGIGVILDWVPAHFPSDAHGLAYFDGTALYEHADPREGFHKDWNTLIYNLGRREVQGFLIASALFWLEHFHIDGLRVDAVASMLYRDYSRKEGEWIPNRYGGRENLEAIDFLKRLNAVVRARHPGAMTIAEESTAWPGVTAADGLGFSYKWNMGWMHDTLSYVSQEPVYRRWHHNAMTFGLVYAWSEQFVLPLSHDEVVHGKGSLYGRVPGDAWQKLATLRAYFAFMWTHPGRKLLFMGGELASPGEWNHDGEIEWDLLKNEGHAGVQRVVGDLNRLYAREPALHAQDGDPMGFRWVVGDDSTNSVFAYERVAPDGRTLLVVVNMTPVPRHDYRVAVFREGIWHELLNTDSENYGGSNMGNGGQAETRDGALILTLPPLATLVLG
jgi:1,4-alpha-glucan branching enzyme